MPHVADEFLYHGNDGVFGSWLCLLPSIVISSEAETLFEYQMSNPTKNVFALVDDTRQPSTNETVCVKPAREHGKNRFRAYNKSSCGWIHRNRHLILYLHVHAYPVSVLEIGREVKICIALSTRIVTALGN